MWLPVVKAEKKPLPTVQPASSLRLFLFPTALWEMANSSPVHSLMLSSHLFFYLPLLLAPLMVCTIVRWFCEARWLWDVAVRTTSVWASWPLSSGLCMVQWLVGSCCGPIQQWHSAKAFILLFAFYIRLSVCRFVEGQCMPKIRTLFCQVDIKVFIVNLLCVLIWSSSLVTWSLYEMLRIFRKHLISMA